MFDISGGIWAQQYLEYLTGEVYADDLDRLDDFISTDRQSVNWTEESPATFRDWGQHLIKKAVRDFDEFITASRRDETLDALEESERLVLAERLHSLSRPMQLRVDRILACLAQSSRSDRPTDSLSNVSKSIVQLAEDASINGNELALTKRLIAERHAIISQANEFVQSRSLYRLFRQNPWLILGPWNIVIENPSLTKSIRALSKERTDLESLKLWSITHQDEHYIVAFGEATTQAARQLLTIKDQLLKRPEPRTIVAIVFVATSRTLPRMSGVTVSSVSDLLERNARSCDALSELLSN